MSMSEFTYPALTDKDANFQNIRYLPENKITFLMLLISKEHNDQYQY